MRPCREQHRLPLTPPGGRGRGHRGRLLFAYFLLARQEKVGRRAGATTPLRNVVQTLRALRNCMLVRFPVAGISPPQATSFSCLAKKRKQKKATPVSATPPALRHPGQPALLAAWAHCTTRYVHFVHCARTGAMSQFTKRAMLARRPCHCAPRRGHRGGGGSGSPFGPSLRLASSGGFIA